MDDLFGDLDAPAKKPARGGRRGRRAQVDVPAADPDDLFSGLDFGKNSQETDVKQEPEQPSSSSSSTFTSSKPRRGRGRTFGDDDDDDDDLFGNRPSSTQSRTPRTSAVVKQPELPKPKPQTPAKQDKIEDEFGGFDISGLYFGGGGDEDEKPSKSSSSSRHDFNPFGNDETRFGVVNETRKTRQLDMNKTGPKKPKTKKNTTKSTGPKWNRPTFDFTDDDDLELDEEELGQGTIGNGNRAGVDKPESTREQADWTDGIEPAKKVEKPKKKKKKKKPSRHMYSDDEDDDGIPSF